MSSVVLTLHEEAVPLVRSGLAMKKSGPLPQFEAVSPAVAGL